MSGPSSSASHSFLRWDASWMGALRRLKQGEVSHALSPRLRCAQLVRSYLCSCQRASGWKLY
jgi:hypothetical protein